MFSLGEKYSIETRLEKDNNYPAKLIAQKCELNSIRVLRLVKESIKGE